MSAHSTATPKMNPWVPDSDPHQSRRLGKTLEELGELTSVLARICIQGIDAIDPASGKTNRLRMFEETADVLAQLQCNLRAFDMDDEAVFARADRKILQMLEWESHFSLPTGDGSAA